MCNITRDKFQKAYSKFESNENLTFNVLLNLIETFNILGEKMES